MSFIVSYCDNHPSRPVSSFMCNDSSRARYAVNLRPRSCGCRDNKIHDYATLGVIPERSNFVIRGSSNFINFQAYKSERFRNTLSRRSPKLRSWRTFYPLR
jgi:hypothetical protein